MLGGVAGVEKRWIVSALVVLVSVGCGDSSTAITEARAEGSQLFLTVASCTAEEPEVEVSESADEVRVSVDTHGDNEGDCLDGAEVTLTSPLGERQVIDESTDSPVPVFRD